MMRRGDVQKETSFRGGGKRKRGVLFAGGGLPSRCSSWKEVKRLDTGREKKTLAESNRNLWRVDGLLLRRREKRKSIC